ncbi:Acyl carrier protein 1, mitochondrial [Nowakowskiella sp. JEL0078]|nr:Acyl carrier protein 1, mitochondrial [Nowakowskiella sp. JEL0078]
MSFVRIFRKLSSVAQPRTFRFIPVMRIAPTFSRLYSASAGPLTVSQIEDRVLGLLSDFEKVDASKLTLDAHFVTDLGLDSLDQVEVAMALEDEFNIELADRDAEEIFTPRQAVEKIFADKHAM